MRQKAVTAKQIQRIDKITIEKIGIPGVVLMERAGGYVAYEVYLSLRKKKKKKVSVFCGIGNNAGDGFVIARYLDEAGMKVKVFVIPTSNQLKNDAKINYQILKKTNVSVKEIKRITPDVKKEVRSSAVIVDAIFGVGLNREVKDPYKSVIEFLNKSKKEIISVDTPSGLDATTGKIHGVCIKAKKTVTFTFSKTGFYKNEGPKHTGKIIIVDIGIPKKVKRLV